MYQPGDFVLYGRTGVCKVERIETGKDGQKFYALSPLYQSCDILTPVDGKVFMRPVLSRQEAEKLIDAVPGMEAEVYEGMAQRELTERYQAAIATHDCRDLFRLTISIYAKKKAAERARRKFGAVDERFMKEGEALLFGELAVALGLSVDEVRPYISRRLAGREKKKPAAAAAER